MQFYANECNEGRDAHPQPQESNSTLTSGTGGAQPPPIPYILGEGVNFLTLRVQFYANECNSTLTSATGEETLAPNPSECNSTLMSGTRGIYPNRYVLMFMSGVIAYVFSTRCGVARGKFVSDAKVLAAVSSISQPRRVYEDRLETGGSGKELSTNNEIQSFGPVLEE